MQYFTVDGALISIPATRISIRYRHVDSFISLGRRDDVVIRVHDRVKECRHILVVLVMEGSS